MTPRWGPEAHQPASLVSEHQVLVGEFVSKYKGDDPRGPKVVLWFTRMCAHKHMCTYT